MHNVKGIVSDIQRYCIHDGPGIRTVVFLKGCPLNCIWCSNPESKDFKPDLYYTHTKCIRCLRCVAVCPANCIKEKISSVSIDRAICTRCFECIKLCPSRALIQKGSTYTVDEIVDEVMRDEPFFKSSKGGITLSGGEVLGQYKFAVHILKTLKQKNIHTAIETSGYSQWKYLKLLSKYSDLILYDIKHFDNDIHKRYTGVSNELIIKNLDRLIECGENIVVRIPLIPGFNMDDKSIEGIIKILKELKVSKIDILLFHQLGSAKYASLGLEYSLANLSSIKEEDISEIRKKFEMNSFEITVGG